VTPGWSIVIPAFNEARRLPSFRDTVVAYFEGRDELYEVIVVDDGSTDGTSAIVDTRQVTAVRVLRLQRNAGKGAAVRAGMLATRGAYRLFADADGATPIEELKRLEPALMAGADVVIGSRALVDSGVSVTVRRLRVVADRMFNWLVARAGLEGVADSQCSFKAFTAAAAGRLFEPHATRGFGFDVELLMLAKWHGFKVAEVAVNWVDKPGSKVGVFKTGPGMFWEIVRARLRMVRR